MHNLQLVLSVIIPLLVFCGILFAVFGFVSFVCALKVGARADRWMVTEWEERRDA